MCSLRRKICHYISVLLKPQFAFLQKYKIEFLPVSSLEQKLDVSFQMLTAFSSASAPVFDSKHLCQWIVPSSPAHEDIIMTLREDQSSCGENSLKIFYLK